MKLKRIISIILVLVWMSIIFSFSGQKGTKSGNTSKAVSRTIVNITGIGNKYGETKKEEIVDIIEPIIRKIAHYTLYTIGGIIIINCIYQFYKEERKLIFVSSSIGILYAITDELHQLVVSGRSAKIADVIIDTLGILTGVTIFLLINQLIEKIIKLKNKNKGDVNNDYRAS